MCACTYNLRKVVRKWGKQEGREQEREMLLLDRINLPYFYIRKFVTFQEDTRRYYGAENGSKGSCPNFFFCPCLQFMCFREMLQHLCQTLLKDIHLNGSLLSLSLSLSWSSYPSLPLLTCFYTLFLLPLMASPRNTRTVMAIYK